MTDQQADPAIGAQRGDEQLAGVGVDVVGRLVQRQHVRAAPQGQGDLGPLAFAMAERLPPVRPVRPQAELPANPARRGLLRRQELRQRLGAIVGPLGAIQSAGGTLDRPPLRRQLADSQAEQRALAGAVGADNARPAKRKPGRQTRQQGRAKGFVAEMNVQKIQ